MIDVAAPVANAPAAPSAAPSASPFDIVEGDITFFYCTEFIVEKKKNAKDALKLRAYLETIGDCVVVVDDDAIIKVHVHTDHPGKALEEGLTFGIADEHEDRKYARAACRQTARSERKRPVNHGLCPGRSGQWNTALSR